MAIPARRAVAASTRPTPSSPGVRPNSEVPHDRGDPEHESHRRQPCHGPASLAPVQWPECHDPRRRSSVPRGPSAPRLSAFAPVLRDGPATPGRATRQCQSLDEAFVVLAAGQHLLQRISFQVGPERGPIGPESCRLTLQRRHERQRFPSRQSAASWRQWRIPRPENLVAAVLAENHVPGSRPHARHSVAGALRRRLMRGGRGDSRSWPISSSVAVLRRRGRPGDRAVPRAPREATTKSAPGDAARTVAAPLWRQCPAPDADPRASGQQSLRSVAEPPPCCASASWSAAGAAGSRSKGTVHGALRSPRQALAWARAGPARATRGPRERDTARPRAARHAGRERSVRHREW